MTPSPRHGAPGCRCEECLTDRIRLTVAMAADGRDLSGLRARLDGFRARVGITSVPELLQSVAS
jgi:hypothetical protein